MIREKGNMIRESGVKRSAAALPVTPPTIPAEADVTLEERWQVLHFEPGECYMLYSTAPSGKQVQQAMDALRTAFRGHANPPRFTIMSGPISVRKTVIGEEPDQSHLEPVDG